MVVSRKMAILFVTLTFSVMFSMVELSTIPAMSQKALSYPEVLTALKVKVPNSAFSNKTQLLDWLGGQVKQRKMDKPLTADLEAQLRKAGAPDELIEIIRENSPPLTTPTPAPSRTPPPVSLGDLLSRAENLVKPEYTTAAREARTTGDVKLALEIDEEGRVTSVTQLTTLPNGLAEKAVEAARKSTFKPATRNFKPAKGEGVITYSFKLNQINVAEILAAANAQRISGDCDRAISEYSRIVSVDSKNAPALLGRGICYLIKREYQRAKADTEAAAVIDQNDPEKHFFLAVSRDLLGEHVPAAAAYARALSLRPDLDKLPRFRCLYLDRPGMTPDKAASSANEIIQNCNQAIIADPFVLLYYKRGIGYRLKSEYGLAIADFENVRKLIPAFTSVNTQLQIVYNARGLAAFNKKDYKQSLADISLAISEDPNNSMPYLNRCAVRAYGLKQYDEAIEDCSTAIRLATKSSMAYNHRGYALEMKKKVAEAAADYEEALKMDPANQTARANLARVRPQVPTLRKN